jgi:hypothetical protein
VDIDILVLLSLFLPYISINGRSSQGWDGTEIVPFYLTGISASDFVQEITLLISLLCSPLVFLSVFLLRLTEKHSWPNITYLPLFLCTLLNVGSVVFFY